VYNKCECGFIFLWAVDKSGRPASTEGVASAEGSRLKLPIVPSFPLSPRSPQITDVLPPRLARSYLLALRISTLFMPHKGVVGGGRGASTCRKHMAAR